MEEKVIYSLQEKESMAGRIFQLNETFEALMKKLGAKVINSTYILSDGNPTEAYGYYVFDRLGIVATILNSENSECNFSIDFSGFEGQTESYNKLKFYIEETLKKAVQIY